MAKALSFVWFAIAAWLWVIMVGRDVNLLISAVISVFLVSYAIEKIDAGALEGFRTVVTRHRGALYSFVGVSITTFGIVSMLSGDWNPAHKLQNTCVFIGQAALHIHHWAKGLGDVAWHGDIFDILHRDDSETRTRAIRLYSERTFRLSGLLAVGTLLVMLTGITTPTLLLSFAGQAGYFLILAAVTQYTTDTKSRWFRIYLAVSIAIALAIAGQGFVSMFRDLVLGGQIPSSLIFWHSEGDPTCAVL